MFLFKVLCVVSVALVAVSAQQPAQFPAGVDPALCPGFPICDNARLHDPKAATTLPIHDNPLWNAHAVPGVPTTLDAAPAPQPQWNAAPAQPQWNVAPAQPQWNAAPAQPQWNAAPAQPQWNAAPVQAQWNAAPVQPQWNAVPVQHVWNFAPTHVQDQFSQWQQRQAAPAPAAPVHQAPAPVAAAPQPQAYAPVETNDINDTPGGDKFPAGVNPQACPNYPYCDTNTGLHAGVVAAPKAAPLPGYTERQYPAGVNPAECPNFPYCN